MRVLDWGKKKRTFHSVAFDATGRFLAAGGDYGEATCVWDVTTGVKTFLFECMIGHSGSLHFHPTSNQLLLQTNDGLKACDPATGRSTGLFAGGGYVGALSVDPTDDWAVCSHQTRTRRSVLSAVRRLGEPDHEILWHASFGETDAESGYTYHLSCLADGERFLSAEYVAGTNYRDSRFRVAIRSRDDGRLLQSVGKIFGYGDRVFGSCLTDAVIVLSAAALRVHALDDLARPPRIIRNDNRKYFTGVAFHPSGRHLAATSNDATVKLYDTTTWEVTRTFTWDIGKMRSVAFSPDGTLAAAGSDTGKVVVWDVDLY